MHRRETGSCTRKLWHPQTLQRGVCCYPNSRFLNRRPFWGRGLQKSSKQQSFLLVRGRQTVCSQCVISWFMLKMIAVKVTHTLTYVSNVSLPQLRLSANAWKNEAVRRMEGGRLHLSHYEAAVSVTLITVLFVIRIAKWSSQRDQSHKKKKKHRDTCYVQHALTPAIWWRSQENTEVKHSQLWFLPWWWWWRWCCWTVHVATHSRAFFFLLSHVFFIYGKYIWKCFRVWTTLLKCERGISSVSMGSIISECW